MGPPLHTVPSWPEAPWSAPLPTTGGAASSPGACASASGWIRDPELAAVGRCGSFTHGLAYFNDQTVSELLHTDKALRYHPPLRLSQSILYTSTSLSS